MYLRPALFAAPVTVAVLSFFAGCGDTTDPPANTGGASATAGSGPGGGGAAGVSGGGVAGTSVGGSPAGGVAGTSAGGSPAGGAAGTSVGGSPAGGSNTAGTGGDVIPPTFDTVKLVLREISCYGASCHDFEFNPLHLNMGDGLRERMLAHQTKYCGPLINLANPPESAFIKIMRGPCGDTPRMPSDGCVEDDDFKCVPENYIQAMEAWIAAGAPP